jgi:hypothetical protein
MGAPELARVKDEQVDTRPLLGGAVHAGLLTARAVCVKRNLNPAAAQSQLATAGKRSRLP